MTSTQMSNGRLSCVGPYDIGKSIGEGQFGSVRLGTHAVTGEKVAIKVINKKKMSPEDEELIRRELMIIKLLQTFKHPHIIRLIEIFDTKKRIFIVMEYASGGEILDFIVIHGKLPEKEARRLFVQIVEAVSYCHCFNVVHRDLKPENILLDSSLNVKLIDFSLSTVSQQRSLLQTYCGSPTCVAPEILRQIPYDGFRSDIWSLGVILFILVSGSLPFYDDNLSNLMQKIVKCEYYMPPSFSPDLQSLIRGLLNVDPQQRLTIDELRSHPWLVSAEVPAERDKIPITEEKLDSNCIQIMARRFQKTKDEIINDLRNAHYLRTYCSLLNRKPLPPTSPQEQSQIQSENTNETQTGPKEDLSLEFLTQINQPSQLKKLVRRATSTPNSKPEKTEVSDLAKVEKVEPPKGESRTRSNSSAEKLSNSPVKHHGSHLTPIEENTEPANQPALRSNERLVDSLKTRPRSVNLVPQSSKSPPMPPPVTVLSPSPLIHPPLPSSPLTRPSINAVSGPQPYFLSVTAQSSEILLRQETSPQRPRPHSVGTTRDSAEIQGAMAMSQRLNPTPVEPDTQPRQIRFACNQSVTSEKAAPIIIKEVLRKVEESRIPHVVLSEFCIQLLMGEVSMEVEVCQLPRLPIHGVRFHRLRGDIWKFKEAVDQLIQLLNIKEIET